MFYYPTDKRAATAAMKPFLGRIAGNVKSGKAMISGIPESYRYMKSKLPESMLELFTNSPGTVALAWGLPLGGIGATVAMGTNLASDRYNDKDLYKGVKSQARNLLGRRNVKDDVKYLRTPFGKINLENNAMFDGGNRIFIGSKLSRNPYVMAHELGHAQNIHATGTGLRNKAQRMLQQVGYKAGNIASNLMPLGVLGVSLATGNPVKHFRRAPLYGLAAFSPVLLEEAMATRNAFRNLKEADPDYSRWKATTSLGGAYGTYLLSPTVAAPAAMFGLASTEGGRKFLKNIIKRVR